MTTIQTKKNQKSLKQADNPAKIVDNPAKLVDKPAKIVDKSAKIVDTLSSKIIEFKGFWKISDVKSNPKWLFVYGDNNVQIGKGGQAIIRDLDNTIGIPTKKYPSNDPKSFYTDADYDDNCKRITNVIKQIIKLATYYDNIVFPENGFGTGLAKLPTKAPDTYNYLINAIDKLKTVI